MFGFRNKLVAIREINKPRGDNLQKGGPMAKDRPFRLLLPLLGLFALGGVSHSQSCGCYQITELYEQACSSTNPLARVPIL